METMGTLKKMGTKKVILVPMGTNVGAVASLRIFLFTGQSEKLCMHNCTLTKSDFTSSFNIYISS